jgi:hypothetical protein
MKKSDLAIRLKLLGADFFSSEKVTKSSLNDIVAKYGVFSVKAMNLKFKRDFLSALHKAGWTKDKILSGGSDKDSSPVVVGLLSDNREKDIALFHEVMKKAEAGYLASVFRSRFNHHSLYEDQEYGKLILYVRAQGASERVRVIDILNEDQTWKAEHVGSFSFEPVAADKLGGTVVIKMSGVGQISFDFKDFGSIVTDFKVKESDYKKILEFVNKGLKRTIFDSKKKGVKDKDLD